jgi:hypothetical protein
MSIAVIILNWNGKSDTLNCLESVYRSTHPDFTVIVVDNGSTDGSPDAIRHAYPQAEVIETGENLGYAEGNNVGIRRAMDLGVDSVLVLNNDTVVDPDAIAHLELALSVDPSVGLVSPFIFFHSVPDKLWFGGAERTGLSNFRHTGWGMTERECPVGPEAETEFASGCAMLIRSVVFEKTGLFDPRYFLVWEEVDLCFRARRAGYRIAVEPKAKVWHKVSTSFEDGNQGPIYQYFSMRNRLLWIEKNLRGAERVRAYSKCLRQLRWAVQEKLFSPNLTTARLATLNAWLLGSRDYFLRRFGPAPSSQLNRTRKALV